MNRPEMHEAMARILNAERGQPRTLFNQAPAFISVLRGPDHVFELANEAYCQLAGQRDIIGKPLREALPDVMEQGYEQLLDRVFETGRPVVVRGRRLSVQREPGGDMTDLYIGLVSSSTATGPGMPCYRFSISVQSVSARMPVRQNPNTGFGAAA